MDEKWKVEIDRYLDASEYPSFYADGKWVNPNDVADALNSLEAKLKAAMEALGLMPYRVREMYDAETESGIDPASTAAGLMFLIHDLSNNALENIRNMVAE